MLLSERDVQRFWSKVNKTETCWLWTGGIRNKQGYGRFKLLGKDHSAHIISYVLYNNDYIKTKDVCHKCDVTNCVNPKHLFLGTRSENMLDCVIKGRHKGGNGLQGEAVSTSKLTKIEALDIRNRLAMGERVCSIVLFYTDISRSCVEAIRDGKTWKSIQ